MEPTPPLNEKLIACVLQHIEDHPDEYYQNWWVKIRGDVQNEWCGTQGCFAGWTMLLSTPIEQWGSLDDYLWRRSTINAAARKLGLTDGEASELFRSVTGCSNKQATIAIIKERLRAIRRGRGLPPDGPAPEVPDDKTDNKESS